MKNSSPYNPDVVAIVHRIFTEGQRKKGGADKILEYLSLKGEDIILIEHPLSGLKEGGSKVWNGVIISTIHNGIYRELTRYRTIPFHGPFAWIQELVFNFLFVSFIIKGQPILISVDPLNSLIGVLLPQKFKKIYFHCIDYSNSRFSNIFLDTIYIHILKLVLQRSNIVGVVSLRIKEALIKLGCADQKIFFIPNSPDYKESKLTKKIRPVIIYTGGAIIDKYDYEKVLDMIFLLKRKYKSILLYAVGGVNEEPNYIIKIRKQITAKKLSKNIVFTGFLNKVDLEKLYIKSKLGLSFYSSSASYYTYFGDSLKIREYALYGIPTICDGNSATDLEMEKAGAGFIIHNVMEAENKIRSLLDDKDLYGHMQKNCIHWAKKMDKVKILNRLCTLLTYER